MLYEVQVIISSLIIANFSMVREVITVVNTAMSSVRNKCSLYLMYQKKKKNQYAECL